VTLPRLDMKSSCVIELKKEIDDLKKLEDKRMKNKNIITFLVICGNC